MMSDTRHQEGTMFVREYGRFDVLRGKKSGCWYPQCYASGILAPRTFGTNVWRRGPRLVGEGIPGRGAVPCSTPSGVCGGPPRGETRRLLLVRVGPRWDLRRRCAASWVPRLDIQLGGGCYPLGSVSDAQPTRCASLAPLRAWKTR